MEVEKTQEAGAGGLGDSGGPVGWDSTMPLGRLHQYSLTTHLGPTFRSLGQLATAIFHFCQWK